MSLPCDPMVSQQQPSCVQCRVNSRLDSTIHWMDILFYSSIVSLEKQVTYAGYIGELFDHLIPLCNVMLHLQLGHQFACAVEFTR